LIRANANATTEVTVGVKAVPNVDANQLLRGLAVYRARNTGLLLLDGHFVLLKPDRTIAEIPVTVYDAIAPVVVLLVEADAVNHPFPAAGT
jgi:adenylate kinase